jgi:putative transposase
MQRKMDPEQSLDDIPKPQKKSPVKPLSYYEKRYGVRNRSMAEAYRSGYYTLKNIGDYFGVSYATVGRALKEVDV